MAAKSKVLMKVIDGIKSWNVGTSQSSVTSSYVDIEEGLKGEHFSVGKIAIHGFPYRPTCIAFDPIQKITAIGTKTGAIRLFGRPGVDYIVFHPSSSAVLQIIFLVNEGGLISICQDDVVHLWNIRQKNPELVHSLQFKREHITCGHVPLGSSWLYLGTDKGNVYVVNVQQFSTSGYVINWNKAIDISQSTHPGCIVHLSENPQDSNKLLIGFSSGLIVLWDLQGKAPEIRFKQYKNLTGLCWHWEGKSFMASHKFGLLVIWSLRSPQRPVNICCPHSGSSTIPDNHAEYETIYGVTWLPSKTSDPLIIFSGGGHKVQSSANAPVRKQASTATSASDSHPTNMDQSSPDSNETTPASSTNYSLSIKCGKRLVVLQLDYPLVQFTSLCNSPYINDTMDPYAIAILLQQDLVLVDLLSPNYCTFENPYPMDLSSSPVTCCSYLVDCLGDLVPLLYSVGNLNRTSETADSFSSREWPISGGQWGTSYNPYPEVVITGHADGSIRFWDASEVTLTPLCKIRTQKYFIPSSAISAAGGTGDPAGELTTSLTTGVNMNFSSNLITTELDPYAIRCMHFCPESRQLVVGAQSHACFLLFSRKEQQFEIPVLDINMAHDCLDETSLVGSFGGAADAFFDDGPGTTGTMTKENASLRQMTGGNTSRTHDSTSSGHSIITNDRDVHVFVPVRPGLQTWSIGFQPTLICRSGIPAYSSDSGTMAMNDPTRLPPSPIRSLCLNSSYGLLALSNDYGFALVDHLNRVCLISVSLLDLASFCDVGSRLQNRSSRPPSCYPCDSKSVDHQSVATDFRPTSMSESSVDDSVSSCVNNGSDKYHSQDKSRYFSKARKLAHKGKRLQKNIEAFIEKRTTDESPLPNIDQRPDLTAPPNHRSAHRISEISSVSQDYFSIHWSDLRFPDDGSYNPRSKKLHRIITCLSDLSVLSPLCATLLISSGVEPTFTRRQSEKCPDLNSSPFSGSLSTSTSSLEQASGDGIRCIVFAESYPRKGDCYSCPSVVIGTSRGNVLLLQLNRRDCRASLGLVGSIFRVDGEIIHLSFLDMAGNHIPSPYEKWDDASSVFPQAPSESKERSTDSAKRRRRPAPKPPTQSGTKQQSSNATTVRTSTSSTSSSGHTTSSVQGLQSNETSPVTTGPTEADQQILVICSEKQVRMIALPSQSCIFKMKITETSQVVRASVQRLNPTSMGECTSGASNFLACYLANGHFVALSLPSLRVLLDVDYLPYTESVSRSFAFGQHGQAVYLTTPSELLKITWAADVCANLKEMQGELFIPCNMPEPPKKGFFTGLFSGALFGPTADRDELFGESASGKGIPGTSTLLPSTKMDKVTGQVNTATSEIARARNAAIERGERLQQTELQTQEMMEQAKGFGRSAAMLAAKYEKKDKRWGWPL